MKVVHLKTPASHYNNDTDALDEYDLAKAKEQGADLVIYWYSSGGYEGSGNALVRKGGLWTHCCLSHCSCYGPGEDLYPGPGESLDSIEARMSGYLLTECAELLARARRYK